MVTTSRGQMLNVWMIVFTILITATFAGRFAAYLVQKRKLRGAYIRDRYTQFKFLATYGENRDAEAIASKDSRGSSLLAW